MTDERLQELQNHHNPIVVAWFNATQLTNFYTQYKQEVNNRKPKYPSWKESIDRQLQAMNQNADFPIGFKTVEWEYANATEDQQLEFKEILILVSKEETDYNQN